MKPKPNWNLLNKYLNKESSEQEKAEFENWLGLSEENQLYFNQIKEACDSYKTEHASYFPNKQEGWKKINTEIDKNIFKPKKLIIWTARVAASLILMIGLYFLIYHYHFNAENQEVITEITDVNNNSKKVTLPDGTLVWLNKTTTIKYPKRFDVDERIVQLSGEAYFEVKKNEKTPFVIQTSKTETRVLGTSFNLRAYDKEDAVRIVVNSGKVAFYSKAKQNKRILLTKGQAGSYLRNNKKLTKSNNCDINYNSWKTGILLFQKSKLDEVCRVLEHHFDKKIIIEDPVLKEMLITASYRNPVFEEIIETISQTLDIKYKINNGTIIFSPNR